MVKTGDIVRINGKEYLLGSKLGGGLEGNVFNVDAVPGDTRDLSKYVIKIIDDSKINNFERLKILNHLKKLKSYRDDKELKIIKYTILPAQILDDELGYIMKKANEHEPLKKYLDLPAENVEEWLYKTHTIKKRYQIIINLFEALKEIHRTGLIFTDLSPNNIMINKTKNELVLIDTDNMRNKYDYFGGVLGTFGYMAPEIYHDSSFLSEKKDDFSNCGKITVDSDIFSAAIIAFQLLTLQHPFIGDEIDEGSADDEEQALKCKTDYIFKKGTTNSSTKQLTKYFDKFTTEEIKELFYRTFVDGRDNPNLRPTDMEFYDAFNRGYEMLIKCPMCGLGQIYNLDDVTCCGCKKTFDKKMVLKIYNCFRGCTTADIINNIGNYVDLNVDDFNLLTAAGDPLSNDILISKIIIEKGLNNKKALYLRHFEETEDRDIVYATIMLSEEDSSVSISVNTKYFKTAFLVNKKTKTKIPLDNGQIFNPLNYGIIFDVQAFAKGNMIIFGKFVEE